jgi:hypothetical protein
LDRTAVSNLENITSEIKGISKMSKLPAVYVAGRELTPEQQERRAAFPDDRLHGGIEDIAQRVATLFNTNDDGMGTTPRTAGGRRLSPGAGGGVD